MENKSTSTGENIVLTKKLLAERGLNFQRFIVVQKPYMERRTFATFKQVWPEADVVVTSPPIPFDQYPNQEISKDTVINIMVGDLQRIREYPKQGFQVKQKIPSDVWQAYEQLVALGFTKHLIKA